MEQGTGNLGQLLITLGVDTSGLNTATTAVNQLQRDISRTTDDMNTRLRNAANQFREFGNAASMYLTLPLALVGREALNMTKDFDSAMQKIVGLVGVAQTQVDDRGKSILEMSPKLGRAPVEMANALYFVTSSGFKGAEALNIMTQSAKAASAGLGETQAVADLVTSAMSAYKDSNLTAAQTLDILTAAVREGKGEATQFAHELGEVIPVASRLGISFDQVAAASAAMTLTGSSVEETATYLRQIMVTLMDTTPGVEKALKMMGTSGKEMRQMFKDQGLLQSLKYINDLTNKWGDDMMGKVFPNIRALTGVLSLMGDRFEDNVGLFDRVNKSTGDMEKAFAVAAETIDFKYNQALDTARAGMIQFGLALKSSIVPILESLASGIKMVSDWLNSMSEENKKTVVTILAITAAIGPMALAIGGLLRVISMAGAVLSANPFILIAAGIAATVVALKGFSERTQGVTDVQATMKAELVRQQIAIENNNKSIKERIGLLDELNTAQLQLLKTDILSQKTALGSKGQGPAPFNMDNFRKEMDAKTKQAKSVGEVWSSIKNMFGAGESSNKVSFYNEGDAPLSNMAVDAANAAAESKLLDLSLAAVEARLNGIKKTATSTLSNGVGDVASKITDMSVLPKIGQQYEAPKWNLGQIKEVTKANDELAVKLADIAMYNANLGEAMGFSDAAIKAASLEDQLNALTTAYTEIFYNKDSTPEAIGALDGLLSKIKEIRTELADTNMEWTEAFADYAQLANQTISVYGNFVDKRSQKSLKYAEDTAKQQHKSDIWLAAEKDRIERERAKKAKAIAILEATINTAVAVSKALPNVALAVATGIAGAVQIGLIAATPLKNGGVVPNGFPNDTYPALLTSGETVVPAKDLDSIRGNGNTVIVMEPIVSGTDIHYIVKEVERRAQNSYL